MIKLMNLLKEIVSPKSKMIIMAGGAGAGKSTLVNKIKSYIPNFTILNPDDYVEGRKELKGFTKTGKVKEPNLTNASLEIDNVDAPKAIENRENFLWDTTASNSEKIKGFITNNSSNYDTLMIMVYTHPIVSFLRNFKRERKVPKLGVIQTWNNVYGNIETYKDTLGDNFVLYQAPDTEYQKEINEFNKAVSEGRLYKWLEELVSSNPEQFASSFRKTPTEPLSPEEQAKKDKAAEKSREQYQTQVQRLEQEFTNINDKIQDSISTEPEVLSKVKSFVK